MAVPEDRLVRLDEEGRPVARAERLWCAAAAALLVTIPVAAQQAPTAITLAEALRRTEEVTPSVVSSRGSVRSAEMAVRQAKWAFVPTITATPQANLQMNSGQSRVDPITGAVVSGNTTNPSYGMNLSARLPLFDGFARNHSLKATRAREDAADANYVTSRFQAALAVTNAFFDALANRELLQVSAAAVARAEEQLKVATARLRSGSGQRTDSLTALVTLGQARQNRLQAQANLANAEASLGRLVGVDQRVAAISDSAFYLAPAALDTTALRSEATATAPAIRSSEASVRAAQAQLRQQKAAYFPAIDLSASSNWNAGKTNDYTLEGRRQLLLGFSVTPWTNYSRETQVENQSIALDNAEATLADQRRLVSAQLTQNFASLANAQEAIEVAKSSVQASQENVRVAEQRYKLGVMTIVELMQIQEQLTQAEVNEIQARFTYLRTKAQIEALVGRRVP